MVNGISVSEVAALKLKEVMSDEGQDDSYLRIVVMPGSNGGAQYMLSLEEDVKSTDSIIDASGVGFDDKGNRRTIYSLRHTYATFQLVNNNVDMHTLAKQMGTSILMLEKHYSHLTPRLRKDVLTR